MDDSGDPSREPSEAPDPLSPAIVLVRPQEEGNVGAVARAMANLGLGRLILVEPAVAIGDVALARAVGARHILLQARREPSLGVAVAPFQRVAGTTSSRDRDLVPPIGPRELAAVLAAEPHGTATAVVFGPESSGLTNDELARLDPLVRVPCSPAQPTLNLSQAVVLLAWEVWAVRLAAGESGAPAGPPGEAPATAGEVEGLADHAGRVLAEVGFARDDTAASVLADLRRLAARARLTPREVAILRGICRRTLHAVGGSRGGEGPAGGDPRR